MAGPGKRFQGDLPNLTSAPYETHKRRLWQFLRKLGDSTTSMQTFLDQTFNVAGGALQGLLTVAGGLLTFDGTSVVQLSPGDDNSVLATDSAAVNHLRYQAQLSRLMQKCTSSWRMEEANGLTRVDSIGGNDLFSLNTVQQVAGKVGFGAGFNSASTRSLQIPNRLQHGLNPGLLDFSISAWINVTTITNNFYVAAKGAAGSAAQCVGYNLGVIATTGQLMAVLGDSVHTGVRGGQFSTNLVPSLGVWHHVVMTAQRAGSFGVYLDLVAGVPRTAGDSALCSAFGDTTADCSPSAAFAVGAGTQNAGAADYAPGDGSVDCLHFFNGYLLTAADRALLYSAGLALELQPIWASRFDDAQNIVAQQLYGRR